MSAQDIATHFVKHYFGLFDGGNRAQLGSLYRDQSMLSFEGEAFKGVQQIINKLTNLKFQKSQHSVNNMLVQDTGDGGMMILVIGSIKVDDSPNSIKFSQNFLIMKDGNSF